MSIKYEDNSGGVIDAMDKAILRGLEIIGGKGESYAKLLCPVGTPESTGKKGYVGGTLRNSITHMVDDSEFAAVIGTNVEYAPYVELGTVKMKPRPYLRPAIEDHVDEYKRILEKEVQRG